MCTSLCARPASADRGAAPDPILHVSSSSSEQLKYLPITIQLTFAGCRNASSALGVSQHCVHALGGPDPPMQFRCWFLADQTQMLRSCKCKSCATLDSKTVSAAVITITRLSLLHSKRAEAHLQLNARCRVIAICCGLLAAFGMVSHIAIILLVRSWALWMGSRGSGC